MNKTDEEFSYDDFADAFAETIDEAPYNKLYERPAMLSVLPPMEGKRILEAGCGAGWYTEQLLRRGAHVTAVDRSAPLMEHARRRVAALGAEAQARAELRVADLRRPLDFAADASFDGIVSALVLHYLRDWGPTMAEFRRVLKPGGWLLFSTGHPAADASRLPAGADYFEVAEEEGDLAGIATVRFYRRSLTNISDALAGAGLGIARIVEPRPTEAFRELKPDSYERLLRFPEFIFVIARPW
ncbi:MAG TPA: class I SAM-dependent methyltransferase [Longimicrobium sp.]